MTNEATVRPTAAVRLVESIYSRQSESIACQRKPTAPLALSSTERLHKNLSPASRLLSGQADRYNSGFFIEPNRN